MDNHGASWLTWANRMLTCFKFWLFQQEAIKMMDQLQYWVCVDDTGIGRPQARTNMLSEGMIFLDLVEQLTADDATLQEKYAQLEEWSIKQSLQHIQVV